MTSSELRTKFIEFFKAKGHVQIPSASLVPENDPTVLFTTAGMHPLVPFLLGQEHPSGKRLMNYQRCLRTQDIDDVGDNRHTTFFEMLGAWSLGDYFKESIIPWTFEFMTKALGFDPNKLYVSIFEGDADVERDSESYEIWKKEFSNVGIEATLAPAENPNIADGHRIYQYGKDKNWWGPAGQTGPCGPDTEFFYDTGTEHNSRFGEFCHPNCDCGRFVEIGNDVFMEFNKTAEGDYIPLEQKNVDIGWGLERLTAMTQGKQSVYETEIFAPSLATIQNNSGQYKKTPAEIISDHIKASVFLLMDGVFPSNKDQGYVLRRLIRKSVREARKIELSDKGFTELARTLVEQYGDVYPDLVAKEQGITEALVKEIGNFRKTVEKGNKYLLKEVPKIKENPQLAGQVAFDLYQTYGFPPEITFEILTKEEGVNLEQYMFDALYRDYLKAHQEKSRKGAEQKFAGGLVDHSERVVRMHTATHLLHQALRDVLGSEVFQKGSNITAERLRFDFSFPRKMTDEEVKKVENRVNEQVAKDMTVERKIIPLEEARKLGAIGLFGEKYGDTVSVYIMGDYSKEFCGGPHVEHTGQVGKFKILKEEAVSAGVRRVKATVE